MLAMRRALRSLYYPAFYLTTTGLALVLAPDLALKLLFSTGHYGDVMPRMAEIGGLRQQMNDKFERVEHRAATGAGLLVALSR
jgi:hypothetical protein